MTSCSHSASQSVEVAFRTLPTAEPIRDCALCAVLRVNPLNLGSAGQSIVASHGIQSIAPAAAFSLLLSTFLVVAAPSRRLTARVITTCVLTALATAYLLACVGPDDYPRKCSSKARPSVYSPVARPEPSPVVIRPIGADKGRLVRHAPQGA